MGKPVLAIDFGSTFTKVSLIDLDTATLLATAHAPTTVETDVTIGLEQALSSLRTRNGTTFDPSSAQAIRACSSAAGGLKVVVVGLVRSLSVEAAQRAALGAGAKIVGAYSGKLGAGEVKRIATEGADVVLLGGGTDGGDEGTLLHNARLLADSQLAAPLIVAGNKAVGELCAETLRGHGKTVLLTENILPDLETLNVEPVRQTIRKLFMTHIIHAKGIDKAQKYVQGPIVPTPSAVLRGAQLLAEGIGEEAGLGELVVVDVGGATTDVPSIARGEPSESGVILRGLPEPLAKRTVEGDLGLRENAVTLVQRSAGRRLAAMASIVGSGAPSHFEEYATMVTAERDHVPQSRAEEAMDLAMARMAVELAMERHAGTIQEVYTSVGSVRVQRGKDLSSVKTLIGVGGVFARGANPRMVLEGAMMSAESPFSLKPKAPALYIDRSYILYATGLLADLDAVAALRLAKRELVAL